MFPTTLGVNAFRGFLNEFMQQQMKLKKKEQKTGIIKVRGDRKGDQRPNSPYYNPPGEMSSQEMRECARRGGSRR